MKSNSKSKLRAISEEKNELLNTEKALLNILDDYSEERLHAEDSQRALLNILDDNSEEKIHLENTQRAVLNILEDYSDAKEKAEESTKLKEAFLANMSHEIRTPMNAIIGFSDILSKGKLLDKEREYVNTIKVAGENLLTIINDILDISKIEAGMMTFEEHSFSVNEIFKSLDEMLHEKAREKNLDLIFIYPDGIPIGLMGDPTRLKQIIINLVQNAIKFTQKGKVEINVKVVHEEKGHRLLEFSVKDTGIGIPQDKLNHIFERFRQAESHITRKYGGTGLGLSIAKQLVELQGGVLSVNSEIKVGSCFSFSIPYKRSVEAPQVPESPVKRYSMFELSKLNILLVEDNQLNVKLILSLFSEYNLKVQIAENGAIGLEKLKESKFDIVLMDMEMPVMNGYEAASLIRNELKSSVPIIAMTAHAMAGERERCLSLGMNDYISKPVHANLLFDKIYDLTISNRKFDMNEMEEPKTNVCDLTYLAGMMGGKNHLITEIIDVFLNQVPEELRSINLAVDNGDYPTISRFAHTMKSSVSIMGIAILTPILQEMENMSGGTKDSARIIFLNKQLNSVCADAIKEIKKGRLKYA